ncbi:hypothetical protein Tsp_05570 [Trichinella spiralis]|uniref:hypothetical protein n=1 Tax=Trichinella spiralis TaxID=6334 RepID=UPI0001EFDF88|nr:hypothetical protein Tsp_05570 [Trichinella spiralis]
MHTPVSVRVRAQDCLPACLPVWTNKKSKRKRSTVRTNKANNKFTLQIARQVHKTLPLQALGNPLQAHRVRAEYVAGKIAIQIRMTTAHKSMVRMVEKRGTLTAPAIISHPRTGVVRRADN